MRSATKSKISVAALVKAPLDAVWKHWTVPEDITHWNHASDDWHTPWAKNHLTAGGEFVYRMEAKDGSGGFDFSGVYNSVILHKRIACTLGDGRKVEVTFSESDSGTILTETFDAEQEHSLAVQRDGWQAILINFKNYVESVSWKK